MEKLGFSQRKKCLAIIRHKHTKRIFQIFRDALETFALGKKNRKRHISTQLNLESEHCSLRMRTWKLPSLQPEATKCCLRWLRQLDTKNFNLWIFQTSQRKNWKPSNKDSSGVAPVIRFLSDFACPNFLRSTVQGRQAGREGRKTEVVPLLFFLLQTARAQLLAFLLGVNSTRAEIGIWAT